MERIRESTCKPKDLNFPFLLDITPTKKLSLPVPPLTTEQMLEEKVSLIAFRQILSNVLHVTCIFSYTIINNLKKLIGTKPLIQNSVRRTGLSSRIIPHYPPKPLWETLGMGENPSQQQNIYSFFSSEKSSIVLHLSLSKVSFPPHQISIFI